MYEQGNLQMGDIEKKKKALNKTGGINTGKAVFQTEQEKKDDRTGPYMVPDAADPNAYMARVDALANRGPVMQTRIHTQNSKETAAPRVKEKKLEKKITNGKKENESAVRSVEKRSPVKAMTELKVFNGDVMQNGEFTPKAKEAGRHFFEQVKSWAGSYNDKGSGFYSSMGINGVLDCIYIDGMNFRDYVKEQYYYKGSGDQARDQLMLQNYLALIAARGKNVITLVRPNIKQKGDEAEVEFANLEVSMENVGEKEAAQARALKEKGNQIRRSLKKRMERDMTEQTGIAFRQAMGYKLDGFKRMEAVKEGLRAVDPEASEDLKIFHKSFDAYYGGLQKLGLKPGRDDINLAVSKELLTRCEGAIEEARRFLSENHSEDEIQAVKKAEEALLEDKKLLENAIEIKLSEPNATVRLDELLDSKAPAKDPDDEGGDEEGDDGENE